MMTTLTNAHAEVWGLHRPALHSDLYDTTEGDGHIKTKKQKLGNRKVSYGDGISNLEGCVMQL